MFHIKCLCTVNYRCSLFLTNLYYIGCSVNKEKNFHKKKKLHLYSEIDNLKDSQRLQCFFKNHGRLTPHTNLQISNDFCSIEMLATGKSIEMNFAQPRILKK